MSSAFVSGRNPPHAAPRNITERPPIHGTVPIDTASSSASSSKTKHPDQAAPQSAQPNGVPPSDVAGVLRRNQACLACRRRKLKCDAVRPHCSTCVRSYRHLLRTAPATNPTLSCEYDDAEKEGQDETSPKEDDEGRNKKKRKASGGRRKDEVVDEERDRLMKRVAELEEQLARKTAAISGAMPMSNTSVWNTFGPSVDSNDFLGMLSAADGQSVVSQQPMWTTMGTSTDRSDASTGLTPFLAMPEPSDASMMANGSQTPQGGSSMLSPNVVFNFSPAPTGPATLNWSGDASDQQWSGKEMPMDNDSDVLETDRPNDPGDGSLDPQVLVDLFWPGWPRNLPEPPVTQQLVELFFEIVPNIPRILHRARFLARLALPPTHSNFPHPSLLHAICSLAASWVEPSAGSAEEQRANIALGKAGFHLKPSEKADGMPFSLRQAAFGKDAIQDGLNTGNRLFDVVRAMIILSRVFIDDTRMLECWTYCGLVARMILPLGLNVRSAELSLKSVMLPPPVDALEREERRIVVWMAMYHDTIASAASGWGTSMSLDELTIPLPVSKVDFDRGQEDMDPNPQDLESLDLYIKHPVVDPLVLALKAAVLLNRVNKFARKWKNRRLRHNDDLDGMQRPEFRELANAIACLQMSFPDALKNPAAMDSKKRLDVDLVSAHAIPNAAIICLYEPFADITDPNDQPARRILNAAKSIIGTIQQVIGVVSEGATNLAAVMHSSSSIAVVTAARTCLLFYRHALNIGDRASAESLRADIEAARTALGQYGVKFKIGYHHSQLIEYFLDRATNPSYEKLKAHYPEHPRPGAIPLSKSTHLGKAILTALDIKRGYWRIRPQSHGPNAVPPSMTVTTAIIDEHSPNGSVASSNGSVPGLVNLTSNDSSTSTTAPSSNNGGGGFWSHNGIVESPQAFTSHFSPMKYLDFSTPKDQRGNPSPPASAQIDAIPPAVPPSPETVARFTSESLTVPPFPFGDEQTSFNTGR